MFSSIIIYFLHNIHKSIKNIIFSKPSRKESTMMCHYSFLILGAIATGTDGAGCTFMKDTDFSKGTRDKAPAVRAHFVSIAICHTNLEMGCAERNGSSGVVCVVFGGSVCACAK
jgi:hypothetical protein